MVVTAEISNMLFSTYYEIINSGLNRADYKPEFIFNGDNNFTVNAVPRLKPGITDDNLNAAVKAKNTQR